ncbi:hypothetical protein BBJ28_00010407 [Nothophytophthora sp. Chile5]|nr:hypothetical protein BBJ28_00010407 [Nothophytophthora sp. Chile5]
MAEMEEATLQAFEPTWVVYDPADPLGIVLALITLSPVYVMVMYVTLVGFQRDLDSISALLGQLINEVLNKVLKKAINQPRPDGARLSGSGMPSAHSQFVAFFAAYVIVYTMNKRRLVGQWLTIVSVFVLAVLTCYSRAHLGYHSTEQIAVGALIGMLAGFAWNALVSTYGIPVVDGPNIMKQKVRDQLKELDLPYTLFHTGLWAEFLSLYVSSHVLDDANPEGSMTVVGDGETKFSIVARGDMCRFIGHILVTAPMNTLEWATMAFEGDRRSPKEIAKLAEKKLGKKMELNLVDFEENKKNCDTDFMAYLTTCVADGRAVPGTEEEVRETVARLFPDWNPAPQTPAAAGLEQLVIERIMAKHAETKALQAFELTWVVYDPKDPIGLAMAFFTLAPVCVPHESPSSDRNGCTWRQMISEVLNKVLKKSINQRRPTGARMSGSGMPSAHSQFSSFFASYAVAYTWSRYVPLLVILQSLLKNNG